MDRFQEQGIDRKTGERREGERERERPRDVERGRMRQSGNPGDVGRGRMGQRGKAGDAERGRLGGWDDDDSVRSWLAKSAKYREVTSNSNETR